jgi:alpha-1,3-rhamnosyltransferase
VNRSLVSIGVFCYRQAKYVPDALRSVAVQDYRPLEVFFVDDGSPDESVQVARAEIAADPRLASTTVIADGVNRGLATRMNQVLERASGEWVVWLASDDALVPGAVRTLVSGSRDDVDVVFGDLEVMDERGRPRGYSRPRDSWQRTTAARYSDGGRPLPDMFAVNNFVPGGMALIRRSVLVEAGGYDPETRTEDLDMWLRIGWTRTFRYVGAPVGRYRVVPGSTSRSERVNTLDQARIMRKHVLSGSPGGDGYARLAAMRWALAVGRGRGRPGVGLREVADTAGLPLRRLLRVLPAAAARPILGAVAAAARLLLTRRTVSG